MASRVMKIIFGLLLTGLLLAVALFWWASQEYRQFTTTPLAVPAAGATLMVPRGMHYPAMVRRLVQQAYTEDSWHWRVLGRLEDASIQAGEYALSAGMTPVELLEMLRRGRVIQYRFTLVEGWNFRQLRQALAAVDSLEHTTGEWSGEEIMSALDVPEQHPEGRFLPETYQFIRGDTDLSILQRAHEAMADALSMTWQDRAPDLPLQSPDELLILASIVEKETGLASERAQVAGVFIRRLRRGMLLQTDPTVIYGIGPEFDGNIRRRDLQTDTPYNTYIRPGLPPTPIAMPGTAALQASAHPADGDSLYFVADGEGGHRFSRTLEEHNRAVRQYLQRRRQQ